MQANDKIFTLEEVNALLPEVEKRLKQLQKKKEAYARQHDVLFMHELINEAESKKEFVKEDDLKKLEKEIQELESSISALDSDIKDLQKLGCIVRNIEFGWIDFLGKVEGQKVFFSWKLGEKEVQYYRLLDRPLQERRALKEV